MFTQFAVVPQCPGKAKSNTSCLPCRRKKKRCDGQHPRCGRCRDSYGRDECTWPAVPEPAFSTVSDTEEPPAGAVEDGLETLRFPLPSSSSIPSEFQRALPSMSPEAILQAAEAFQSKVLCSHPSYKQSVFAMSLPLAVKHEPLMHAWISAILISGPGDTTQRQQQSVLHYDHAVRGLKRALLSESPIDENEWKRATALLCHAVELLQPVQSPQLARSHLQGAHYMFQLASNNSELPASEHDTLLFEAYIMRAATNCLLHQDIHLALPFEHIRQMSAMHQRALSRLNLEVSTQTCPWLGVATLDLMDAVYKVAWLNAHLPLSDANRIHAIDLWRFLITTNEETSQDAGSTQDERDKAVRCVYRFACQLIARQFLPDAYPTNVNKDATIDKCIRDLDMLTRSPCDDSSLQWPLIVFGAFATTQEHQSLCSMIAARFSPRVPQQTIDGILAFWEMARQIEDERLRFRDCEILRSILL